eukprot:TRINITY_DN10544_c0_g1_i5.p1 TRINITY_DN10544_c0_g1~~TRINITY_DN10544_c0_g1_i5.p1  ORF type:complete len:274 (+),score=77.81 TRINITY_DN10544_c0_g1_i5:208-1029(+)
MQINLPVPTGQTRNGTFPSPLGSRNLSSYSTIKIKKPTSFGVNTGVASNKVRKSRNVPQAIARTQRTVGGEELDVYCLNCMGMVKQDLARDHSLTCSRVKTEVKFVEQCSVLQQADYKIRKLKEAIVRMGNSKEESYQLQVLVEYCDDMLKITNTTKDDILKCREVVNNLSSLVKTYKGPLPIAMYMERVLTVSKEKFTQLIEYYREINGAEVKSKKELEEIMAEKRETLRMSFHAKLRKIIGNLQKEEQTPIQISNLKYSEVNSDVAEYLST